MTSGMCVGLYGPVRCLVCIRYLSGIYHLYITYLSHYLSAIHTTQADLPAATPREARHRAHQTRHRPFHAHNTSRISRPQYMAHLTPTSRTLLQLLVATPSCNTFHEIFCPQHFLGGAEMKQQGHDEAIGDCLLGTRGCGIFKGAPAVERVGGCKGGVLHIAFHQST